MHNLGNQFYQTQNEMGSNYESGYELSPEFEFENENENEYAGESQYELLPEFESGGFQNESYEAELAQELMEVQNEAEFLDWMKKAAKTVTSNVGKLFGRPEVQQAATKLSDIAKNTLPGAGEAAGGVLGKKAGEKVGTYFGGGVVSDTLGAAGQKIGGGVGKAFGEWAGNRVPGFINLATNTLRNLSREINMGKTPDVKAVIVNAAAKHYPIILQVKGTLKARIENSPNRNGGAITKESEFTQEGEMNEVTEMELASELLSLNSEAELDHFFGKVGSFFKKVGQGAAKLAGGPLGGMLKGLAKKALPIIGGAIGSAIVPGAGTAIGSALGSAASNLFELELEGLSAEDREFETARAFIRFAGDAARRASRMNSVNANQAARLGIVNAARRYAPGLLTRRSRPYYGYGVSSTQNTYVDNSNNTDPGDSSGGNWYREGNRIIIQDAFSN
ncbi:MAG: hypothetical protein INR73_22170 [Williamsia sp.]|nr:hypothetical protein [Williamsia sp.]